MKCTKVAKTPKILTGGTKVSSREPVLQKFPMPPSPEKWTSSTEISTIRVFKQNVKKKKRCKFPSASPHWPATLDAIQDDDQEKMLALLQDMKIDLNYKTDQVIMNARTHISATK